ncbi:hypothetical protein KCU62_g91, partial [Aureobasidium sp. EXF-3399]
MPSPPVRCKDEDGPSWLVCNAPATTAVKLTQGSSSGVLTQSCSSGAKDFGVEERGIDKSRDHKVLKTVSSSTCLISHIRPQDRDRNHSKATVQAHQVQIHSHPSKLFHSSYSLRPEKETVNHGLGVASLVEADEDEEAESGVPRATASSLSRPSIRGVGIVGRRWCACFACGAFRCRWCVGAHRHFSSISIGAGPSASDSVTRGTSVYCPSARAQAVELGIYTAEDELEDETPDPSEESQANSCDWGWDLDWDSRVDSNDADWRQDSNCHAHWTNCGCCRFPDRS